jgi:hypothetical protein
VAAIDGYCTVTASITNLVISSLSPLPPDNPSLPTVTTACWKSNTNGNTLVLEGAIADKSRFDDDEVGISRCVLNVDKSVDRPKPGGRVSNNTPLLLSVYNNSVNQDLWFQIGMREHLMNPMA